MNWHGHQYTTAERICAAAANSMAIARDAFGR
jgi:hypothetical protein